MKMHPPHSRDFSRELGGWALCVLRGFLYFDDQKVLSAKKLPLLIRHTKSGSTSIKLEKNPAQKTDLSIINSIKEKK